MSTPRAQKMVSDFQHLKKSLKWDHQLIKIIGALVYADVAQSPDPDHIKAMKDLIKSKTKWTSHFRGNNEAMFAILLSLADDPEALYDSTLAVFDALKDIKFKGGLYLPLAALTLAKQTPGDQIASKVQRMRDIYDLMKANHKWLTNQDDYVYAALLATSDLPVEATSYEIEVLYKNLLEEGFKKGNALQDLTHVLVLGEESSAQKVDKVCRLKTAFKKHGYVFRDHSMASLGVLALISHQPEHIVEEVVDLYDWLSHQKGFGKFTIDKTMRLTLAASLVAMAYANQSESDIQVSVLANSIQAIIMAQQVALMTVIIASTTVATTST